MQARLREEEARKREPVAIVSMACRMPGGASTPESFWELLTRGTDTAAEPPPERWSMEDWYAPGREAPTPGRTYTRRVHLLDQVDRFDAGFFRISPREANRMDPQQRLLLELAWEAMERALLRPEDLRAGRCGVFLGMASSDYDRISTADLRSLDGFTDTGRLNGVAAGRISYTLGLNGPALALDTTCSSSLVALHYAVASLRRRECDMALSGGADLLLSPESLAIVSQLGALSEDGRCKTFDAAADGYGRGEGAGLLLLQRLSDALEAGNPILAVIRGSAVNHDGAASGLTVPNGSVQAQLLRDALDDAGLDPQAVGYVEAHGTGTPLGDPIEVNALAEVFGERESPLLLGSVKTNIGHLEGAAGVAGVIKLVLALQHREIPPHLHLETPNPAIEWDLLPIRVPTERTPWRAAPTPRVGGVSSFGFAGTNAHLLIEEAPACPPPGARRPSHGPYSLCISGQTAAALEAQAARYRALLDHRPEPPLAETCQAAATGRVHFAHRRVFIAETSEALREALGSGRPAFDVEAKGRPRLAALFTGQGAQYPGMGRELYRLYPTFRQALDQCAALLEPHMARGLIDVLFAEDTERAALVHQTETTQPALFAVEYALYALWRSFGVEPDVVLGHSVGEYVAACVAGVFSLEDAIALIAARGRLMAELPERGAMLAVEAEPSQVEARVASLGDRLSVAAINGPESVVLSGAESAIAEVQRELQAAGMRTRPLQVSHAFHSPLMAPMLSAFRRVAEGVSYREPQLALISNLSGEPAGPEIATADYWCQHVLAPVRFYEGATRLLDGPSAVYLELGPRPTLLGMMRRWAEDARGVWLPSMREGAEARAMTLALAGCHAHGVPIDWRAVYGPGRAAALPPLPTYPFQRQRHWVEAAGTNRAVTAASDADLVYEIVWQAQERESAAPPEAEGEGWLILADRGGVGRTVAGHLEALGAATRLIHADAPGSPAGDGARLAAQIDAARFPSVLHLWGLDAPAQQPPSGRLDQAAASACAAVLHLLQAEPGLRLTVVTRGAIARRSDAARARDDASAPLQAALWGLGKAVAHEHPRTWGGLIDLDPSEPSAVQAQRVVAEISGSRFENQIAVIDGARCVPRLRPAPAPAGVPALRDDATYLITGGLGGLGLLVAEWMIGAGARHLVLCSRRLDAAKAARVEDLRQRGADVIAVAADVGDRDEVARALALPGLPPVRGIVHAAGVVADGLLVDLDRDRFAAVAGPKVQGAWNLHRASFGLDLDFFVLFSSDSSLLGATAQGNYGAANAFMDRLAQQRAAAGLAATSINWGPWAQAGMTADLSEVHRLRLERLGYRLLPAATGLRLLGKLMRHPGQVAALSMDWPRFFDEPAHRQPFLAELGATSAVTGSPAEPFADTLHTLPAGLRRRALLDALRQQLGQTLGSASPPPADRGFFELGMDSLLSVEFRGRVQGALGLPMPDTYAFEHPTCEALTDHLLEQLAPRLPDPPQAAPAQAAPAQAAPAPGAIAVVGLACRFPGADTPEQFWENLRAGVDAVVEVPPDRWNVDDWYDESPDTPGTMYTREGGFIGGVDQFDPLFFGISPREAKSLDPQQRLLLTAAWEALERANIAPDRLPRDTGVFIGISQADYDRLELPPDAAMSAYDGVNDFCFAAGRISYTLGLTGPNMAVDTACSSSLTAVDLAVKSLRAGECALAFAGGVHLMLSPEVPVLLSRMRALSPSGRCRTFSAAADGYGRGEGCGVVLLKPLDRALADGDPIWGVIRGTAVNHDGPSSGFTVPSGPAQEALLRRALEDAGIAAGDVSLIEAHGTGTRLGDPVEVRALEAVFGERDEPLVLGAVKSNIGHLEAAAGIAGLIKVLLALEHGRIPPNLHSRPLNPSVDWARWPVRLPEGVVDWPENRSGRRIAGVSGFGLSGTNAHVIVEAAPARRFAVPPPRPHVLTVSAKSADALREQVARLTAWLEDTAASPASICASSSAGRAHHAHRLVVRGEGVHAFQHALRGWLEGDAPSALTHRVVSERPQVAFLFTGQGSQWCGMGEALYAQVPVFREALDRCARILDGLLERPLLSLLWDAECREALDETRNTQPALFAVEYALACLWRSFGVEPDVVMGHSVGEYVAAHWAGVFSLEDGLRLIAARARLMGRLPAGGGMLSVAADPSRVEALLRTRPELVIAARNGPRSCVVSGPLEALEALARACAARALRTTRLRVSHAFHSPLMQPILDAFLETARSVRFRAPQLALITNREGRFAGSEVSTPEYWRDHIVRPVAFAEGLQTCAGHGVSAFVEVGPAPVLLGLAGVALSDHPASMAPTMRRGEDAWPTLGAAAATLYVGGVDLDWGAYAAAAYGDEPLEPAMLPTTAFSQQRYWLRRFPERPRSRRGGEALGPFFVKKLASPAFDDIILETRVDTAGFPFLEDHVVFGEVVVPGAFHIAMSLSAAEHGLGWPTATLEDVVLPRALVVDGEPRLVQVVLTPAASGKHRVKVISFIEGSRDAVTHLQGWLAPSTEAPAAPPEVASLRAACTAELSAEEVDRRVRAIGVDLGPRFGALALWEGEHWALGRTVMPPATGALSGYPVHPVHVDTCFQALVGDAFPRREGTWLPFSIERLRFHRAPQGRAFQVYARMRQRFVWDITLMDAHGQVSAEILGYRQVNAEPELFLRRGGAASSGPEPVYQQRWAPAPLQAAPADEAGRWLLFADDGGTAEALAETIRAAGGGAVLVRPSGASQRAPARSPSGVLVEHIDPRDPSHYSRLLASDDWAGVAHLWALDLEGPQHDHAAFTLGCGSALHLTRALLALARPPSLRLITRLAQPDRDGRGVQHVAQAPLWGMGKIIALEHPELNTRLVDLDAEVQTQTLLAELRAGHEAGQPREEQVAFRAGERLVARLAKATAPPVPGGGFRLRARSPGNLDSLALVPCERRAPGRGEIEIRVQAAGLSFKDVLSALGAVSDDVLGNEAVGEVVGVGEGVAAFEVGDAVAVAGPVSSFGRTCTFDARLAARLPAGMPYAEAATLPGVFATAVFALERLTRLRPGERVLIHAGAGGVGQAAIQLARRAGAEVYTTASRPKWPFLRQQGIAHIYDSRTTAFSEQVLADTGGRGVDVVLNALTGEGYVAAGLTALAEGGRFIEMSKRDVWSAEQVAAYRADVTYHLFELSEIVRRDPSVMAELLEEVMTLAGDGVLTPLPHTVVPIHRASEAFRTMAAARHRGKLVLRLPALDRPSSPEPLRLRGDRSYLVTGGTGALGLEVAGWMAAAGASELILLSRRGPTDASRARLDDLRARGVRLSLPQADVADRAALEAALKQRTLPLAGVIHAAGVLEDRGLLTLDEAAFRRVLAPKVQGSWHLHQLTSGVRLDFFVFFSSATATVGTAGQANYAAANAYMDALAHYRRGLGLPALTVNWGAWAGAGMAAASDAIKLDGQQVIDPVRGLQVLSQLLQGDAAQRLVMPVEDWDAFSALYPAPPALLSELAGTGEHRAAGDPGEAPRGAGLVSQLTALGDEEAATALLLSALRAEVAAVLDLGSSAEIDPKQRLFELGMDSLMAIEARSRFQDQIGLPLPATIVFDYPNLQQLARFVLREVIGWTPPEAEGRPPETVAEAQSVDVSGQDLETLTDQELEALLMAEIEAEEA